MDSPAVVNNSQFSIEDAPQDQSQAAPAGSSTFSIEDAPTPVNDSWGHGFGNATQQQIDQMRANNHDSLTEHVGNIATNFAKGAEGTVAGVSDLIHRIPYVGDKIIPKQGLTAMEKQADTGVGSTADKVIGYGGETLLEFMMGDEALKGLSFAERLAQSAKVAKILEGSPKLMQAIKLGANIGKASTTLGPSEKALIKQYPIIARLVGAGMDAIRAGVTQGAETAVKTPGSVGERVTEGAAQGADMTVGAAAIGAPLATVGGVLTKAKQAAQTVKKMSQVAESAPAQEAITHTAQDMVSQANKNMHARYEKGVQDMSHWLGGQKLDYEGSPLHKAAQELAEKGTTEGKPLDEAFSKTRPGSPRANEMVDMLSNPGAEKEGEAATELESENATEKPPIELDVNELIERRQLLGERLRNLGYATAEDRADRDIYRRLIDGIDDTIKQLGDQTGNPKVAQRLEQINTDYRQKVKLFQNRDVQSLMKGNINDVAARLVRGETSIDDIDAVRKVVGPQNMGQLGDSIFQRWVGDASADGRFDPEKLLKQWNKVKPEVRNELFGLDDPKNTPQFRDWFGKSKAVDKEGNAKVLYHGTRTPEEFDEFSVSGPPTDDVTGEAADTGSGADPSAYMGAHFAEDAKVANMFAEGKGWTSGKVDPEVAKGRVMPVYLKAEKPFNFGAESKLHDFINEGTIRDESTLEDAMQVDGIDPESKESEEWLDKYNNDTDFRREKNDWIIKDINGYASAYGEGFGTDVARDLADQARDRLKKMGHDSFTYNNQVEGGKAWVALEPEQIKSAIGNSGAYDKASGSLTDAGKEAAKQGYDEAMKAVGQSAATKQLVKAGVLTLGAGAVWGPIGALIGFLWNKEGASGVSKMLDYVANSPWMWNRLTAAGEKVNTPAAGAARRVAGYAGGKVVTAARHSVSQRNAYAGASTSLGGR